MAVLVNPDYPDADTQIREVQEAARALGLQLHILKARSEDDIETAFAALAGALLVASVPVQPARTARGVGSAACSARDLPVSSECRGRWPDELRDPHYRFVSSGRRLYRTHSQGCRSTGFARQSLARASRTAPGAQWCEGARSRGRGIFAFANAPELTDRAGLFCSFVTIKARETPCSSELLRPWPQRS
jgi:hypothetical protein